MKDVEKIREGLYVKKGFDGYRIIHPWKNEDGTINYKNLLCHGSYWNLLKLGFILFILLGLSYGYYHDVKVYKEAYEEMIQNPDCVAALKQVRKGVGTPSFNITWGGDIYDPGLSFLSLRTEIINGVSR